MKLETMILIAAAGVGGYYLATRKAKTAAPVPVPPSSVVERVYVEEYPVYGYGWGYPYPVWGGGGRHHHRRGGGGGGRRGGRRR
jgi:hypothetical protein